MIAVLRFLIAFTIVHPLEGIRWRDWVALLRREQYRIAWYRWPKALFITACSLANSRAARRVEREFGEAIRGAKVEAPVFILGHYRSGTTYLHELFASDPRFASPTRYQTFNPWTFLGTERIRAKLVEPFMLPRRVQEDEVAFMNMGEVSPYMDWCFPRSPVGYRRFLTFEGASEEEIRAWSTALDRFARSLSVRYGGRPLLFKSPPHTARMALILEVFPDARFVHIRRDPYAVYVSTIGLLKAIPLVFRLGRGPREVDTDEVIRIYAEMYDAYFEDRGKVPAGQIVEIAYEDLERDPIGTLRGIYGGLSLGDFEAARPGYDAYLATTAGYRKNRHPKLDDGTRRRVSAAWSAAFEAWGYPREL